MDNDLGMHSRALHAGMIRGRRAIRRSLLASQSSNHQLAICYNDKDKLLVKICTVVKVQEGNGTGVTLQTQRVDGTFESMTVMLDRIKSIYPISDFPH